MKTYNIAFLNLFIFNFGFYSLEISPLLKYFIIGYSLVATLFLLVINISYLNKYMLMVIGITFYGVINGLARGHEFLHIMLEMSFCLSILNGLFLINRASHDEVFAFLKWSFVSGACVFFYHLFSVEISQQLIELRALTWTGVFLASSLLWPAPYLVLTSKTNVSLGEIMYVVIYVGSGFLFLKRANLAIMLTALFIKYSKSFNASLLFSFLVFIGIYYLSINFGFYADRFTQIMEGYETYGRFEEVINAMTQLNGIDLFFGSGFGSRHSFIGTENFALHIGAANLIYKFGVFGIIVNIAIVIQLFYADLKYRSAAILSFIIFVTTANFWDANSVLAFFVFTLLQTKTDDKIESVSDRRLSSPREKVVSGGISQHG